MGATIMANVLMGRAFVTATSLDSIVNTVCSIFHFTFQQMVLGGDEMGQERRVCLFVCLLVFFFFFFLGGGGGCGWWWYSFFFSSSDVLGL